LAKQGREFDLGICVDRVGVRRNEGTIIDYERRRRLLHAVLVRHPLLLRKQASVPKKFLGDDPDARLNLLDVALLGRKGPAMRREMPEVPKLGQVLLGVSGKRPCLRLLPLLVDRTSPGVVRLGVPKRAFTREYASYEVAIQTRSCDELYSGKTIGEAIRSALDEYEDKTRPEGYTDPVVPSWYRVSRMQREIAERTLERHRHEDMGRGAEACLLRLVERLEAMGSR
jgi:hypothetical protein